MELMRLEFEPIDMENLPNTSNIDGVPIYANPIKLMRRLFFKRLNLCLKLLEVKTGNVLDVGCGSGIILPSLSSRRQLPVPILFQKMQNPLGR